MLAPLSAQQTVDRARAIMRSGRGAALPELLKIIETLSLNICEVTISELAELIEKDAVVLAKIISVANTISHNPGISPLSTLTQAIHQIGYNRIRTLAVSLMLLDTAGAANPPEQREAAAQALCAGLLAQATAENLGTHDPEFVFACAALRNFGSIMFAAVSIEHCRQAAQQLSFVGAPEAYRAQFGLSPLEFTRRLLSRARLPAEVLGTLRDCEPESLAGVATTYDARLLGIADYGTRLACLTLEGRHGSEAFAAQTRALGRRFEQLVPGATNLARPILQHADERLQSFSGGHGARALPTKSLARIDWRIRQLAPAATAPDRGADASENINPAAATPALDPALDAPPLPAAGPAPSVPVAPAASIAAPVFNPASTDPLLDTLAFIRREFSAQECWLFRVAPGETSLSPARTLGHISAAPPATARIDLAERSVFGVSLQRRENVLIHDASQLPHLPRWFRQNLGAPAAFALFPLPGIDTRPPALLLIGWSAPRRIVVTPAQINLVHSLFASPAAPQAEAVAAVVS